MTLHALVAQLRAAGIDVPAYHSDGAEWRIEIAVGEAHATPYTMGAGNPALERAMDLLRTAGHTPAKVQQDVRTKEWEIVLPAEA